MNMMMYRWKGESTTDNSGMFFYIKNLNSNEFWSSTYEPSKTPMVEVYSNFIWIKHKLSWCKMEVLIVI